MNACVEVGQFSDSVVANLARFRLESEGIESFVVDEYQVTNQPLNWIALGGVKLFVAGPDADEARQVLETAGEADDLPCPECSSTNLTRHGSGRRFAFLMMLFVGVPLGRVTVHVQCNECDHTWRE